MPKVPKTLLDKIIVDKALDRASRIRRNLLENEYKGKASSLAQDEERLAVSGSPLLKDPVLCLLLIRAQLHQKLPGFRPLAAGADGC